MQRYDVLFIELFVGIIIVLIFFITTIIIKNKFDDLEIREKQLVTTVEDATRRTLKGFPEIFTRALTLVQNAEREILMVGFVLNFGQPHLCTDICTDSQEEREYNRLHGDGAFSRDINCSNNSFCTSEIEREYERRYGQGSFKRDINIFRSSFRQKVADDSIEIDILTANDASIENRFLRPPIVDVYRNLARALMESGQLRYEIPAKSQP